MTHRGCTYPFSELRHESNSLVVAKLSKIYNLKILYNISQGTDYLPTIDLSKRCDYKTLKYLRRFGVLHILYKVTFESKVIRLRT